MRLVSWNVARRVKRWQERIDAIAGMHPDILALQEVTPTNVPLYRRDLPAIGLEHIVDCFELAPEPALLKDPRRYGELIASRRPLTPLDPAGFAVPWPERVLSAVVHDRSGDVELHTTHVPPGASHDWIKIEHFEGLAARLRLHSDRPRILCGDFNSPKSESIDGTVACWGNGGRWTQGERSVIVNLRDHDLADVFRTLNGYEAEESSWYWRDCGRRIGRRFDHIFASRSGRAKSDSPIGDTAPRQPTEEEAHRCHDAHAATTHPPSRPRSPWRRSRESRRRSSSPSASTCIPR